MRFVSRVFWPAYLAACLAEIACFSLVDPAELKIRGSAVELSPISVYSIGFIAFVLVGIVSSVLTCYLSRPPTDFNRREIRTSAKT